MKHQKMENVESIIHPNDRISNIPDNVAETILMCLPTRDAVRTSILSRKWRHVWARLPQFVLDHQFWDEVLPEQCHRFTLVKILYQIITHHDGPINKFTLSHPELESCPEIDNLIFLLARSHLEDFTLEMSKDCYLLPNSFFSCQKLRHLSLTSCSIKSSPAFNGFGMLITLKLFEVTINSETLSSLISGSPLLRVLELEIGFYDGIYIDALNLRSFTFRGETKSIMFHRVPVLDSVSIKPCEGFEWNTSQFFQPLLSLASLTLGLWMFENFKEIPPKRLATSLINLKDLELSISFDKLIAVALTFCLLRSSPNLKFIKINCVSDDAYYCPSNSQMRTTYMEGEDISDIWLSELKEVKLGSVTGTMPELEFIRLVLAKSSSLKKFHIRLSEEAVDNGFEILKQVRKFPRLSNEAEIMFSS